MTKQELTEISGCELFSQISEKELDLLFMNGSVKKKKLFLHVYYSLIFKRQYIQSILKAAKISKSPTPTAG